MPASGRHSHNGHRGGNLSLHTCCESQPSFCSQSCSQIKSVKCKFERSQSMDCVKNGVMFPEIRSAIAVLHLQPQKLAIQRMFQNGAGITKIW